MNLQRVFILLVLAASVWGCQEPTQPTDLTKNRVVSVEVRQSDGQAIQDATIAWQRFTGVNAPVGGYDITGADGFARLQVADVSTQGDSIRMTVSPPQVDPFIGTAPIDLKTSICSDTVITLSFDPLIRCGSLNVADTIYLEVCPTSSQPVATECRYYPTDCPPGLIVEAADSTKGSLSVLPKSTGGVNGAIEVCATFSPTANETGQQQFTTTIEGRDPAGGGAQIRLTLTIIGVANCSSCPCPVLQNTADTTDTACVGQPETVTVSMVRAGTVGELSSDCVVEVELVSQSNTTDVEVVEGRRFTLRSGQRIPDLKLRITAPTAQNLVTQLVYRIQTRKLSDGTVKVCEPNINVTVLTPVSVTSCRIEPATVDTLRKCVLIEQSTVDTIYLYNDGTCIAEFDVRTTGPFVCSVLPPATVNGYKVVLPPKTRAAVVVSFTATKADWDKNLQSPRGSRGTKYFSGQLRISGCSTRVYSLVGDGYVNCSAFKYQCLREFRPPQYPDVYAESIQLLDDRAMILYQNDNQAFRRFDIWFDEIKDIGGGTYEATLNSGDGVTYATGRYYLVQRNFFVSPGQSICETYPSISAQECAAMKADPSRGFPPLTGVREGDVILFVTAGGDCALIWIQKIDLDRSGGAALPAACIEICYPMFTLP